jgi:outer membrane protein assembly factor BamB
MTGTRAAQPRRQTLRALLSGLLLTVLTVSAGLATQARAATAHPATGDSATDRAGALTGAATKDATDWPAYLGGPRHTSYSASQRAITPATVSKLRKKWQFTQGGGFLASPTVADGYVFVGANNGWFYKLQESNGHRLAKVFLGYQPDLTCGSQQPLGVVSTATVAAAPKSRDQTVYVAGASGYLYALSARNLKLDWKSVIAIPSSTQNNYYDWSSPTVANGKIYVGVSSNCDTPQVRGALDVFSQSTGRKLGEFYTVPKGRVGGSVWSSAAVAPNGDVYATTGNGPQNGSELLGHSDSILKLSPTLKLLGHFQLPASDAGFDTDFGASPVFFGKYVGACNKNGIFYAVVQATMKLGWKKRIGGPAGDNAECIAAPVWTGRRLYFGAPSTTIGGTTYPGSVQERTAATGRLLWATGLPNGVNGSPSMDGGGVLTVGTFDYNPPSNNATYLVEAANGKILRTLITGGSFWDFPQSVFADNWLFTANTSGVQAWGTGRLG